MTTVVEPAPAWVRPEDRESLLALLAQASPGGRVAQGQALLAGEQASATQVVDTSRLDRFLAFDPATGLLRAEAGLRLAEVEAAFVPRGWGLASVPGHLGGSLGGAIATDAGGMDHHLRGGFGQQLVGMTVATPAHGLVPCGPEERQAFFWATVGGLGLTGVIAEASLRLVPLESSFMAEDVRRAGDLPSLVAALKEAQARHSHARAWLDPYARAGARGRGVVVSADPLKRGDLPDGQAEALVWQEAAHRWWPKGSWAISPWLLESWHSWCWKGSPEASRRSLHRRRVLAWQEAQPRWWGRDGVSWRALLPWENAAEVGVKLLELMAPKERIAQADLSPRSASEGLLEGGPAGLLWHLQLGPSSSLETSLREANQLVQQHGGRVMLAGDEHLDAQQLAAMCPGLGRFQAIAARVDPQASLRSHWARRLHVRGA